MHSIPCFVYFHDNSARWQMNTAGASLFEAARNALQWFREWQGPKPAADTVLLIVAAWSGERKEYHVRVSRVLEHYGRSYQEFFSKRECPECFQEIAIQELKMHLWEAHRRLG